MSALDYNYLANLVRKAQAGDNNAFAEIYIATYQQQYRYAYKYLRDEQLAQDALQETFVQALRHIRMLKSPKLFLAWLNRITFRTCFDLEKKRKLEQQQDLAEGKLDGIRSELGRPEDEVIAIDSRQYIMKQVLELPLTEAQVIVMKYYQHMTNDEIAEVMNISRSTVKRYLKAGREHLSQMLFEFRA